MYHTLIADRICTVKHHVPRYNLQDHVAYVSGIMIYIVKRIMMGLTPWIMQGSTGMTTTSDKSMITSDHIRLTFWTHQCL
jgi:hypothetical protein